MRRLLSLVVAVLALLPACSSSTAPGELVPDQSLTFETAHARWEATRQPDYSFDFDIQTAWLPTPLSAQVIVVGNQVADVRRGGGSAPLNLGFTVDQLWDQMAAARAAGRPLTDLQFSREGIPMEVMIGSFADDSGVRYHLRNYRAGS